MRWAKSNSPISRSTFLWVCDSRARIHCSSSEAGRSAASAPSQAVTISRAAFQSLLESFEPSSIAESEKRTSCVSEFFIRPYRVASVPCFSISSSGSIPVLSDFDIRRPSRASTVVWITTSLKGISPINSSPEKIMRFSQRRMISRAVVCRWPG